MNENEISPKLIEAVKEIIPKVIGISFAEMFKVYQEEGDNLTEKDLIDEILEAGGFQANDDADFEETVTVGTIAMAGPLGLI